MDIWKRLGISPTTDIAVIQSAYASKARECHPEEYPDEFRELQQAYRIAIKYAKKEPYRGIEPADSGIPQRILQSPAEEPSQKDDSTDGHLFDYTEIENNDYTDFTKFDYSEADFNMNRNIFFQDFRSIALNPYMRNNLLCWELFLKQPQYNILFRNDDFRKNFVLTVCRTLTGWNRDTIWYFNSLLSSFQEGMEVPETFLNCWVKKLKSPWKRNPFEAVFMKPSKEQREVHNVFLDRAEARSGLLGLDSPEVMKEYLKYYLEYAAKNPGQVEAMYLNEGKAAGCAFMICVFLAIAAAIFMWTPMG